jgi:FixJ family two-component response regulator
MKGQKTLIPTICERNYKMAKKKKAAKKAKGLWSTKDNNLLKKLFADNPTAKVAAKLGRSVETVKKKASRMGLRKSKRYMKSLGRG